MISTFRLPASVTGAAMLLLLGGCDAKPKPVADILARDSTLALEIFGANTDSLASAKFGDTSASLGEISSVPEPSIEPLTSAPIARTSPATAEQIEASTKPARRPIARNRARSGRDRRDARVVRAEARRSRARGDRPIAAPGNRRSAVRSNHVRTGTMSASTVGKTTTRRNRTETVAAMRTPSRAWLVLPSGSELELESRERICTNTSSVGDVFDATLSESVIRANGTVIPSGAVARGEVTSVNPRAGKNGEIAISIQSITFDGRTYPLSSRVTHADVKRVRTGGRSANAGKVAAGAGVGAILGQVMGKDTRATVIGAAGGAAAGAVLAGRSRTYAQCVPDGGRITAELVQPLRIQMSD